MNKLPVKASPYISCSYSRYPCNLGGSKPPQPFRGIATTHQNSFNNQGTSSWNISKVYKRPMPNESWEKTWKNIKNDLSHQDKIFSTGGSISPYEKNNHQFFIKKDLKTNLYHLFVLKSNPYCNNQKLLPEDGMIFVDSKPLLISKTVGGTYLHYFGLFTEIELKTLVINNKLANWIEQKIEENTDSNFNKGIIDLILTMVNNYSKSDKILSENALAYKKEQDLIKETDIDL